MNSNGQILLSALCQGSLYYLSLKIEQACITVDVWHKRYGHLNEQALQKLKRENMVTGLNIDNSKLSFCEACAEGKAHRNKFPEKVKKRYPARLGLIHSDVCGKVSVKSLGGAEYFFYIY